MLGDLVKEAEKTKGMATMGSVCAWGETEKKKEIYDQIHRCQWVFVMKQVVV